MRIYPAIDIKNGKCVRLRQGKFNEQTVYSNSPYQVAKKWAENGASYIHVVDLDGALDGNWTNKDTIKKIVDSVNIPVQTGGGIRSIRDIEDRLNVGISRVIIGTLAVKNPRFVKDAIDKFGSNRIVVGIDAKDGMVAINGWEELSVISALELCKKMKSYGVKTIVYTDITKDGMLIGPNIDYTKHLIDETGLDIIASGGVSSIKDLREVKNINAEGAIIGKALYTNAVDLKEAIKLIED
ncbi:1-(5-phosphoribosyl)-5-[(5-phosphoribosylamino) methylideneamino] imidazole-4-carboxamide isomerase [Vallitalea longa]|uniref:1-(5-phosphoribosyl)-5-[(5-phosphoribosylamino)methylideneamino] imidazole-4-carboxamide isomerase n=1 Tax=Vallitalea longa TaxID=2936439 RepID=A0A9W6DDY8_9FIRM|nr:1-(5-phosphoribosyl)-5-[(5-phosphoribosylamino)methylideneamino]imidazole-4-carboxamide isomerase [Vallitalea longa]GKX28890.1 1-(5-phosphoribosyl)-5-[(5-phosphoribosylamino) methylideneamino] imidazole-4-carboxamide isomerase [Vallitalea longa]